MCVLPSTKNKATGSDNNNECFIIMPISDPKGYEPGHFKSVYEDIFKPACTKANLTPIRADDIAEASLIHIDILQKLIHADMALCDLTTHNPNVLFELGIRQAFDKPTVLVQESGTKQIFDISPLKYCEYKKDLIYHDVLVEQEKIMIFLNETKTSFENGTITNSIVSLLGIKKATVTEPPINEDSWELNYILSELSQLRNDLRDKTSPHLFGNDNEFYGKILASLQQLKETIKLGIPKNILNKNYNEIHAQIMSIHDIDIRTMLLVNLEEIKNEIDTI